MTVNKKTRFPGQKSLEEVKLLVHKHWIVDLKIFLALLVIGFMPILLGVIFGNFLWETTQGDIFWTYALGGILYLLFIALFVYLKWLNEELDLLIVTNERIISHNQIDLFHRQISEANLSQIQDVKGIESGLFGHILHFGSMEITTAASEKSFAIKDIEDPHANARALLDLRDKSINH